MADLLQHFGSRPLYHGTDKKFEPGDMVEPGHESRRRAPGGKNIWMHEDPDEARSYGPHLYEVEPHGILYDDSGDGGRGSWSSSAPARVVRKVSLLEHFGAWHEGPHYHGTPAELKPGDLIEPGKHPRSNPEGPEEEGKPREHTYFAPRKDYVTEHYGPNVYEVEPTGDYKHDPEYGYSGGSRHMYRSKEPLRVKRQVSKEWGTPHEGLLEHFAAAVNPPCHYCHEPLDEESVAGHNSAHEECEEMHSCPVHGDHDDPMLAEQHRDTHTDWEDHLPFEGGIHRGLVKELPHDVHSVVHNHSRPPAERAHALRSYLHRDGFHGGTQEGETHGVDHEGHLGVHWTPNEEAAKAWGSDDMYEGPVGGGPKPSVTHIMLHARSPHEDHIEKDPDNLEARHMYGFDHDRSEHEVPLKYGAPVHLTGISWKQGGQDKWNRHDFAHPTQHTAADGPFYHGTNAELGEGDQVRSSWREPTHDSGQIHPDQFFTTDTAEASQYGKNLYEVEPTGRYEPDESRPHSYLSRHPLRVVRKAVLAEPLANPYHGNPEFGGNPEFSKTWFHGTTGRDEPDLSAGRPQDMHRSAGSSWPQPNKLIGTHLTPLRSVAHKFAHGVYSSNIGEGSAGVPSAIVHAHLHMQNPAHFQTEKHLNLDIARYADKHHPDWHDQKLNDSLAWNYSDNEGTHRNWHAEHPYRHDAPYAEKQDFNRQAGKAQDVLQWHPKLPQILEGYRQHLESQGHHGITYGNEVEGPGDFGQDVRHISAIATRPSQIQTRHVEHIAPPNFGREGDPPPEPHQISHKQSEARNEPEDMLDRIGKFHAAHGGALPHLAKTASASCDICDRGLDPEDDHENDHRIWHYENPSYTDWSKEKLGATLHRGLMADLPPEVHSAVHDSSRPVAERARLLARHTLAGSAGNFWTDHHDVAKGYSTGHFPHMQTEGRTPVVLHARTPPRHHIEDDLGVLDAKGISGHQDHDHEVPLKEGTPLHVTGISWRLPMGAGHESPGEWQHHRFSRGLPAEAKFGRPKSEFEEYDERDEDDEEPDQGEITNWSQGWPGYQHQTKRQRKKQKAAALEVHDYEGTTGDRSHITRSERGTLPVASVARLKGAKGEQPGEHRNHQGEDWESFKAAFAAGAMSPIFVTVDHGEEPKISEGNHRRDAAVELGHTHIPAEVRYFGHAEQQGTVEQRAARTASAGALYHSGGKDFPGDEDWVHVGTREAAVNRAKDWHEERARRGAPPAQAYLHHVKLTGRHSLSTETDEVANQPGIGEHLMKGGHTVMPYTNEYEDPGTVSYLAHRSAVSLLKTEPLAKTASIAMPSEYRDDNTAPPEGEMHRGVTLHGLAQYHPEVHRAIHDESIPVHERAARLMKHMGPRLEKDKWGGGGVGKHWSTSERTAQGFATSYEHSTEHPWHEFHQDPAKTRVVFHAAPPKQSHMITSPRTKMEHDILPTTHGEREIPLRNRAPVSLTGVSWSKNEKDAPWTRHDFPAPIRVKASADPVYYHGSAHEYQPGDLVDPDRPSHYQPHPEGYAFFTPDPGRAHHYAETALSREPYEAGKDSHVYQVEPTGPHFSVDPSGPQASDRKSVYPLKVVRKASSNGDRHTTCSKGHTHWGAYGAAGLLIRHKGEDGQHRYLLQKRSPYVDEPDTWSVPGGAIGKHETPEKGAWREAREEMGSIPSHVKTHHIVKSTDCGDWAYHTVVADAGEHFMPRGGGETDWETAGVGWHSAKEIDDLRDSGDLHPGFAKSWDAVRRSRGPKTAARYIVPPRAQDDMWQHMQKDHGIRPAENSTGVPGESFMTDLHNKFHRGEIADRQQVQLQHQHHNDQSRDVSPSFTPDPPEKRRKQQRAYPPPERLDDREYSVNDVSRHYDWEGFSHHEISHLVHNPEHATFTKEDVPVKSLRHVNRHGLLKPPPSYKSIASQGEDERQRLDEIEQGYEQGASIPPIVVVRHGKHHIIADGSHRAAIYAERGATHIPAFVTQRTIFRGKTAAARSRQYVQRMHPKDLVPYARQEAYRTDDPGGMRHRQELGRKIQEKGYKPSLHGGMSGDKHYSPVSSPITLVHEDDKSYLEEGHHRTMALDDIGYDKPVPVLVKDFRTPKTAAATKTKAQVNYRLATGPHTCGNCSMIRVNPPDFESYGCTLVQGLIQESDTCDEWAPAGKTAIIEPGSLPARQQSAFDVEDLRDHRRQMLDVAKHPDPGTRVWRGEMRDENEHPKDAKSVGMHWSVNPDSVIANHSGEPGKRRVVWQGVIEDHDKQAFPRSHPMWRGKHESYGHEAEVRFRPGAKVKLEGAYVDHTGSPGYLVPQKPERTSLGWEYHKLDHHVTINHKGHGASDYSELGIPKEAAWFGEFIRVYSEGMSTEAAAGEDLVDVYHHSHPDSIRSIWESRRFEPNDEENRVYGTNLPPGHKGMSGADYGGAAVHLRVPRHVVNQWPGPPDEREHYYDIDADDIKPEHFVKTIGAGHTAASIPAMVH